MTVSPFAYVTGNPDALTGGSPAAMNDIQGPFYDLRSYLNATLGPAIDAGATVKQQIASAVPVRDVGMLSQIRAGRELTLADFTSIGLQAPVGLWNLTNLTDVSGNGRTLVNKGAVPFGPGINGVGGTSAVFSGSTGQALYIADTGASDPFRIKTGSFGCWFRTAKRATDQVLLSKMHATAANRNWLAGVSVTSNVFYASVTYSQAGAAVTVTGVSDVADDRWHFGVITADGTTARLYVDGALEATGAVADVMNYTNGGPLNIGAFFADAAIAASSPSYGRVDEAFVSSDVLSDDQIRLLYAAKLAHTLGSVPSTARLNVRRRRKGGPLLTTDFPASPVRLHNFTAGSLNDEGTGGIALVSAGATMVPVAGADGSPNGAYTFGLTGAPTTSHFTATDAGLPAALAARSYGCWFKCGTQGANNGLLGWGTLGAADARLNVTTGGVVTSNSGGDAITGPFVADGQWHSVLMVEDNAAGDGVRRKMYLDGRLVGGSTVLTSLTLAGANRFRLGANMDGTVPFVGQIDGAFVTTSALTAADVANLYAKGSMALAPSPKNAGDHVEALNTADILFIGDTLDSQHTVDLAVVS